MKEAINIKLMSVNETPLTEDGRYFLRLKRIADNSIIHYMTDIQFHENKIIFLNQTFNWILTKNFQITHWYKCDDGEIYDLKVSDAT